MYKLIVLMLMLSASTLWAATKVYKWVDEEGRIHYSGQKPPGVEVETLNVKTGTRTSSASSEDAEAESRDDVETNATDVDAEDASNEAEAREQLAQADRANSQRLCETSRKNLDALNASVRVSQRDDATGEVRRLTDEERVAALAKAQKAIRQFCR